MSGREATEVIQGEKTDEGIRPILTPVAIAQLQNVCR